MATIKAADLQVGQIIDKVQGKPYIRGSVVAVNRFVNQQAELQTNNRPIPANFKGATVLAQSPVDSRVLKIKSPPSTTEARVMTEAEEGCYKEGDSTSVSVKVGYKHFTLQADEDVSVWLTADKAIAIFSGR